jgi:hypothetical protein
MPIAYATWHYPALQPRPAAGACFRCHSPLLPAGAMVRDVRTLGVPARAELAYCLRCVRLELEELGREL